MVSGSGNSLEIVSCLTWSDKESIMKRRSTYRVTVRLDIVNDADLIAWLKGLTPGGRSALIRDTLRTGLKQPTR